MNIRSHVPRRLRGLPLILLLTLLSSACASTANAPPPETPPSQPEIGWTTNRSSNVLIHTASKYAFPPNYGDCSRVEHSSFDAEGLNVEVTYACPDRDPLVTVFVYPRGLDGAPLLPDQYRKAMQAALMSNEGSRQDAHNELDLPVGSRTVPALSGFLTWSSGTTTTGSFVIVLDDTPERFVKVRATFTLADDDSIHRALKLSTTILKGL